VYRTFVRNGILRKLQIARLCTHKYLLAYFLPKVRPGCLRAVAPVWEGLFPHGPLIANPRTICIWHHPIRLSHMKLNFYWLPKLAHGKAPPRDPPSSRVWAAVGRQLRTSPVGHGPLPERPSRHARGPDPTGVDPICAPRVDPICAPLLADRISSGFGIPLFETSRVLSREWDGRDVCWQAVLRGMSGNDHQQGGAFPNCAALGDPGALRRVPVPERIQR